MKSYKRSVKVLAKNYKVDPDELLVTLWDTPYKKDGFNYLKNENSVVKDKDIRFVLTVLKNRYRASPVNIEPVLTPKLIIKDYDYSRIGIQLEQIFYLTKEEIIKIHDELTKDFAESGDPIFPPGIKNEALLESALFHSETQYEDKFKYPTIESAGAALMYGLAHNHAFHNGNKRTAIVGLLVFLDKHNICLICSEDELFKISLDVVNHNLVTPEYLYSDAEIYTLAKWIETNSKIMKKGERPITLRKFKQILGRFEAYIISSSGRVQRTVYRKNILGISSPHTLTSKKTIDSNISLGFEMDRNLIKSIREDLELDSRHGIDTDIFYDSDETSVTDFIIRYKNLLKRLSKF